MRVVVTGSSGHLGEGLVRELRARGDDVVGLDRLPSAHTTHVGALGDAGFVRACCDGADVVLHTATLHKPHIASHRRAEFVATNVAGTLHVLEAALDAGVRAMVFTSTTSAFGDALRPPPDAPAAWIDETVAAVPRNIYGVTKVAAEDLCELFHRQLGLPVVVLRTSRFFPEEDDDPERQRFDQTNLKVNELLYRRVDLADCVDAHLLAIEHAPRVGFARYVITATTPFARGHVERLRRDAPAVVAELLPQCEAVFRARGWRLLPSLDRVYDNTRARAELGWRPVVDFGEAVRRVQRGDEPFSQLSRSVGSKGYHRRPPSP